MRLKDIPKTILNMDGSVAGTLVYEGYEPFEFKGKTLNIRKLYYKRDLSGGHEYEFTTGESDELWLCLVYDAYIRSGGKLRDLSKGAVSAYKKYKFRRKPTWFKSYTKQRQARLAALNG